MFHTSSTSQCVWWPFSVERRNNCAGDKTKNWKRIVKTFPINLKRHTLGRKTKSTLVSGSLNQELSLYLASVYKEKKPTQSVLRPKFKNILFQTYYPKFCSSDH